MKRTLLILVTTLFTIGMSSSILAHQTGGHHSGPLYHGNGNHLKMHHRQIHHSNKHHRHYSSHRPDYGYAHRQAQRVYRHQYDPHYYPPRTNRYGHPISGHYGATMTLRLNDTIGVSLHAGH